MKTLWKICKSIFMLLLTGIIVWTILYFTVPKVKDWTYDKVFKIDQSKDDEEKKQLRAENEDLKKQINSLTTEATTVSAELTNVKDQLTAKITALETATSEKQELTSKVSKLEQKVSELETSGAATQTELEAKKQELATAQASLQEKTAEVETLTAEKQTLENQKTTLESQLAEKQNQIQTLQARVTELETQLNPGEDYKYTTEELESFGYKIENIEGTQKYVHVTMGINTSNRPLSGVYSISGNKCKKLLHEDSYYEYFYYKTGETSEVILGERKSITIINNIVNEHKYCFSNRNGFYKTSVLIIDEKNIAVFRDSKGWSKINIETEEETTIAKDDNCSASTTNTLFDWQKISSNKYYGRYNSTYVIYNTETNTVTGSEHMYIYALLKNNKCIVGDNSKYYIFDTITEEKTEISSTENLYMPQTGVEKNVYIEWDNGDVVIMSNYGPVLYSKSNNTIAFMNKSNWQGFKGLLLKTTSGKVFATCFSTSSNTGIYIINVDSNGYPTGVTKIYSLGQYWDTVTEDENGCTFSSKYDPSQGSVYYNYSTGECTAVTE